MDTDSHGDEAQARLSQLVGGKRILAGGEDLLKVAVGSASRRVGVLVRNVTPVNEQGVIRTACKQFL